MLYILCFIAGGVAVGIIKKAFQRSENEVKSNPDRIEFKKGRLHIDSTDIPISKLNAYRAGAWDVIQSSDFSDKKDNDEIISFQKRYYKT